MERRVDREARTLARKGNNIAYLVNKMENCDSLQYDPTKTADENLKEHQDGRQLLEEADNENFLKPAAAEAAWDERDFQSRYWVEQRRLSQGEDVVWLPNMCKLEKLAAGGKQRRKVPMQTMAEQLEGSTTE